MGRAPLFVGQAGAMVEYRNVWVLIVAIGVLQVSGGILGIVSPIGLQALGLPPFMIGLIAALHATGFMFGALSAPRIIARVGNIRVFSAGAAIGAASSLVMGLALDGVAWACVRLIQGAAFAWMFASAESWMSVATPAQARGRVLGLYHVIAKLALAAGPFLVVGYAPLQAQLFIWIALFFALAMVPVCLTERIEPQRYDSDALPLREFVRLAPAALAGAFLAGMINTGALALLPVFAEQVELGASANGAAALAMAAAWGGGLISQWPAGRLSDRIDRRLVVAGMGLGSLLACLGLVVGATALPGWTILALLAIWGAGSLSFYGIAVAHGVDRAEPQQVSGLMASLLCAWAMGSVIGPPLAGFAVSTPHGPGGLFAFAGVLTSFLVGAMLWRREAREEVPEEDRANWEMTRPTSLTGQDIDPRSEYQVDDPEAASFR
ncbi:MAG: MFS transporter [Pseudomonadota bacterium]